MRFLLHECVSSFEQEIPPADRAFSAIGAQAPALTDSELAALHAWATKHGFVLMNERDIELAEPVWRETFTKRADA
jgi:hypothetical protein